MADVQQDGIASEKALLALTFNGRRTQLSLIASINAKADVLERLERYGCCAVMPPKHDAVFESCIARLREVAFNCSDDRERGGAEPLKEHYIHNKEHRQHLLLDRHGVSAVAGCLTLEVLEAIDQYALRLHLRCTSPLALPTTPTAAATAHPKPVLLRLVEAAAIRTSFGAAGQPVHRDVDTVKSEMARLSRYLPTRAYGHTLRAS